MRRADWPERLAEFIEARRLEPFAWGKNDCALFAADAVNLLIGVDYAESLRGYTTERGALGKIKRAGGLRAFAAALPEKPPGLAQRGDVVLVTEAEHHANLIPWQEVAKATGAILRVAPVTDRGVLTVAAVESVLTDRTKVVAFSAVSNVLGIVNPVRAIADAAHKAGALVVLDACQSAPHMALDVTATGADFVAFSAHKMYGPTGIGALWGATAALAEMPTVLTGGSMITRVDYDSADYLPAPAKFEPGTPRLTQAIGWADSIRFLDDIGIDRVAEHESSLGATLYDMVAELDGVHILGTNDSVERVGLVSFAVDGVHPHDVGQYLDSKGIAVRVGHHCAQPLHKRLGVDSSTRISLGVYSTAAEVEYAVDALAQVRGFFGVA